MVRSLWKLIRLRLRPDPGIHFGDAEAVLPAILPGYWRSIYWLALASRCSIWYFERNFERRRRPGTGDWPDPSGW